MRWMWRGHRFWWRISGGRIGASVAGLPVLELITTGHATGRPRSVLLNYAVHPRGYVVVASNGGSDAPPAWWRNLQTHPAAEVHRAGMKERVAAGALEGEDRDGAWATFAGTNPAYARYEAATERRIAVVLLERATS